MIYEYAFASGVILVIPPKREDYIVHGYKYDRALEPKFRGNPHTRQSKNAFGVRFTCRQLYTDTNSAFFHSYTFDLTGYRTIYKAIEKITPQHLSQLEAMKIEDLRGADLVKSRLHAVFPKLRRLETRSWRCDARYHNLRGQANSILREAFARSGLEICFGRRITLRIDG
jgi:hypothetical protein